MKTKLLPLFSFCLLILVLCLSSFTSNSCNEDGSLDELIEFKPEDKYFKSSLKSLHFVLETHPIEEVDKMFKHIIENYGLPTTKDGLTDGTYTGESPYDAFDYKHVVALTTT